MSFVVGGRQHGSRGRGDWQLATKMGSVKGGGGGGAAVVGGHSLVDDGPQKEQETDGQRGQCGHNTEQGRNAKKE